MKPVLRINRMNSVSVLINSNKSILSDTISVKMHSLRFKMNLQHSYSYLDAQCQLEKKFSRNYIHVMHLRSFGIHLRARQSLQRAFHLKSRLIVWSDPRIAYIWSWLTFEARFAIQFWPFSMKIFVCLCSVLFSNRFAINSQLHS